MGLCWHFQQAWDICKYYVRPRFGTCENCVKHFLIILVYFVVIFQIFMSNPLFINIKITKSLKQCTVRFLNFTQVRMWVLAYGPIDPILTSSQSSMCLGQEKLILTQDPKICAQYQTHKTNLFANKTKITTINWGIKASFWNFSEQDRFFFSVDKTLI